MIELPPEVRAALVQLLIETLHQLAKLLAALVADILGVKVIEQPGLTA